MYDHNKLLVKYQKLIVQLQSDNPDKRYDACVELRVSPYIPDDAIEALREATQDPDQDVADAAQRALDFHSSESSTYQIDATSTNGIPSQAKAVTEMYKRIRSWAIWMVIWGVVSIVVSSALDPTWGIVLIVIGVLSWFIKVPAMFVIYSVFLIGAAVSNGIAAVTGVGIWWLALSLFQVIISFTIIRAYRKYRKIPLLELYEEGNWPADLDQPQNEFQITGRFAIASFILAMISGVVLSCTLLGAFMAAVIAITTEGSYLPSQLLMWVESGAVNIAWLAVALSVAAILSKNTRRGWAIAGLVIGGLVLIVELSFILLTIVTSTT